MPIKPTIAYVSSLANDVNKFTEIIADDLRHLGFDVGGLGRALKGDWSVSRSRKVLVLNWYEDRLAWSPRPMLELIRSAGVLLALKARVANIIWIRHNFVPHDQERGRKLHQLYINIIQKIATATVTLRPHSGATHVLPHPIYFEEDGGKAARDEQYILFGSVRASKGIEDVLAWWPADRRLIIFGRCGDKELAKRIAAQISSRGLNVEHHNRFLSDKELNEWLHRSKYAVIPHKESGALVSGTFYHAAGLGMNVLVSPGEFYDYLSDNYSFVQPLTFSVLSQDIYVPPATVTEEIQRTNSTVARRSAWAKLLNAV